METPQLILNQTQDYLLAYKQAGLLCQQSKKGERSLELNLKKAGNKSLHLLTRLDRPVSGLVFFSKRGEFNKHYQELQERDAVEKEYLALVEGKMPDDMNGLKTLKHFHVHDKKNLKARISDEQTASFRPISLEYEVVEHLDNYSILKVVLRRGRFHQIRAQLAHIGFPVKGDVKYGARRGNKDRSIHLHSYKLRFKNMDGDKRNFIAPLPEQDSLWQVVNELLIKRQ